MTERVERQKKELSVLPKMNLGLRRCLHGATTPSVLGPHQCRGFTITLRHNTLSRTPLYEWSARRTDLYLTTHSTHNRHIYMPPAGFEPAIPASYRQQTHATTGISFLRGIAAEIIKLRHWMEVNAELRAHSTLHSMGDPSVFCGQKIGYVKTLHATRFTEGRYFCLCR